MGQNTRNSVWKPCEDLQKTFDLCHCQQRVYNKVLRLNFVIDQILIFHHNLQINSLKILQCDFLDFVSYFVSHSWGIHMMKITGLSHLFKWENLHNWWLTKYFFAPLYIALYSVLLYPQSASQTCVCGGGGSLLNHHQCAASTWMMWRLPQDNGVSALTTHQSQSSGWGLLGGHDWQGPVVGIWPGHRGYTPTLLQEVPWDF